MNPIISLKQGLTDPLCGFDMGQTAELVSYKFGITRDDMDQFAVKSHQALANAQDQNHIPSIAPLYANNGQFLSVTTA